MRYLYTIYEWLCSTSVYTKCIYFWLTSFLEQLRLTSTPKYQLLRCNVRILKYKFVFFRTFDKWWGCAVVFTYTMGDDDDVDGRENNYSIKIWINLWNPLIRMSARSGLSFKCGSGMYMRTLMRIEDKSVESHACIPP